METCSPEEQAACRRQLEGLVEQALTQTGAKTAISTVLNALYDDYKEFRRMKRRQEWPKL